MNYIINIVDTQEADYTTQLEYASKDAIVLTYKGGDAKDDLKIVGSVLGFDMEVPFNNNVDAAFASLFTGDEQRFYVEVKQESNDLLVWQGFLLPDSMEEPYTNGTFYVRFEAVDGLGRLKGKYLPDYFYTDEVSVIDVISTCLRLTGLEMPMHFYPGINNYAQKRWDLIYVDGLHLQDNDKKKDAYSVLEILMSDTLSRVYQHLGVWRVEGLNKTNLLSLTAHHYDSDGVFVGNITINKSVKEITGLALATPLVTTVPPYGLITVAHDRTELQLPDDIDKETNDGWVVTNGVVGQVYATHWSGNNAYFAKCKTPDYIVTLPGTNTLSPNLNLFVNLRRKIYVQANTKLNLKLEFKLQLAGDPDSDAIDAVIEAGHWNNPLFYDVKLNDTVLYSNQGTPSEDESVIFDTSKTVSLEFEFMSAEAGLIDLVMYAPFGTFDQSYIASVDINKAELEIIDFQETVIVENVIAENYSLTKDVDLTFADDSTGFSPAFLLDKLRLATTDFISVVIPVLHNFTQNGKHYVQVALDSANLIADNPLTLHYLTDPVTVLDVIYNYSNGEQMVIQTETPYDVSQLELRIYKINDYTSDRANFLKWTDSIYEVEQLPYTQAVANVYRRMFSIPFYKIDVTVDKMLILFGDIVRWNYREQSNYFVINTSLNFDSGETSLTMVSNVYEASAADNIPPFVNAGPTIYIEEGVTEVNLSAEAYDPDGFIASSIWAQQTGDAGVVIQSATSLDTVLTNVTGDVYQFQIEVTDNDGATAVDTVTVYRILNYTIDAVFDAANSDETTTIKYSRYNLDFTDDIPADQTVAVSGVFSLQNQPITSTHVVTSSFRVFKNGLLLQSQQINTETTFEGTFGFNYISTDVIFFELTVEAYDSDPVNAPGAEADAEFTIDSAEFYEFEANVIGLPVTRAINIVSTHNP